MMRDLRLLWNSKTVAPHGQPASPSPKQRQQDSLIVCWRLRNLHDARAENWWLRACSAAALLSAKLAALRKIYRLKNFGAQKSFTTK
mmetsp:Transcript_37/g.72  ORF Transcript_37/g.72 Transcript_37/m.72 type:complete len:87 (+) Transcript_37:542-802(+)